MSSKHVIAVDGPPEQVMADLRVQALRLPNVHQQRGANTAALVCARSITPIRFGQVTRVHVLVSFETEVEGDDPGVGRDGRDGSGGPRQQFWHVSASLCPDSVAGHVPVPEREVRAWVAAGWPGSEHLGLLAAMGAATHMELQVDELGVPVRRRVVRGRG